LQSPCPSISPSIRLSIRSHFHNRYLSFYWKKWLHIYFLFTVRLTNERVRRTRWLQYSPLSTSEGIIVEKVVKFKIKLGLPFIIPDLVRPSVCPSVHTFITDISASTGRNNCTSTSCLPCDLQMNEWGYS
jgi:hypothetical protein